MRGVCFFWHASLLSRIRCSRLILSIFCPSPWFSQFFNGPWILLSESGIKNQDLSIKCTHCQGKKKVFTTYTYEYKYLTITRVYIYIYTHTHTHLYTRIEYSTFIFFYKFHLFPIFLNVISLNPFSEAFFL